MLGYPDANSLRYTFSKIIFETAKIDHARENIISGFEASEDWSLLVSSPFTSTPLLSPWRSLTPFFPRASRIFSQCSQQRTLTFLCRCGSGTAATWSIRNCPKWTCPPACGPGFAKRPALFLCKAQSRRRQHACVSQPCRPWRSHSGPWGSAPPPRSPPLVPCAPRRRPEPRGLAVLCATRWCEAGERNRDASGHSHCYTLADSIQLYYRLPAADETLFTFALQTKCVCSNEPWIPFSPLVCVAVSASALGWDGAQPFRGSQIGRWGVPMSRRAGFRLARPPRSRGRTTSA